jgi:hypothetical protein
MSFVMATAANIDIAGLPSCEPPGVRNAVIAGEGLSGEGTPLLESDDVVID